MRVTAGFSLIELLIVISVLSIISMVGFVNFKGFSDDQVASKAVGEIQTLLRQAQSNASTSTLCKMSDGTTKGVTSWGLIFRANRNTIDLVCDATQVIQKTVVLENARIDTIVGSSCSDSTIPITLNYATGTSELTFTTSGLAECLGSQTWTFTISNTQNPSAPKKTLKISKGGAINVQ